MMPIKELERHEQIKTQINRKKQIIRTRAQINKFEMMPIKELERQE